MSDPKKLRIEDALSLLRTLEGPDNPGFVRNVVDVFLEDTPKQIQAARQGLETGNLEVLERVAHSLKSSLASFGAMEESEIAAAIELQAKTQSVQGIGTQLDRLQKNFDRLAIVLKSLV